MLLLLALCISFAFIITCRVLIRKRPAVFYAAAVIIAVLVFLATSTGAVTELPKWVQYWIVGLFSRGALATALFIFVMYAGALPTGSRLIKVLMPIRAELSILAAILTLCHNATYGTTYFVFMFTKPALLSSNQFAAGVITIILICLMVPLTITSFPAVRKKMKPARWKAFQRSSYLFYGLLYVHVMLLSVPGALAGQTIYSLTVVIYSLVFLGYAAMRVGKALKKRGASPRRSMIPYGAALAVLALICLPVASQAAASVQAQENAAAAVEVDTEYVSSTDAVTSESVAAAAETTQDSSESEPAETEISDVTETPEASVSSNTETTAAAASTQASPATQTVAAAASTAASKATQNETAAEAAAPQTAETTASEPVAAVTYTYKNGTFSGSGTGYAGTITVSVTIQNDVITAIAVTDEDEDEPYFSAAKDLINDILASQSTSVDTVSGATYSSKGIIAAVEAALSHAKA
ncbi:MAG: hypothetical protein H6Q60_111 [Oscillospiraceae bacterium]|nr:hypothetical protein [Oscillospiraceae bacterium]